MLSDNPFRGLLCVGSLTILLAVTGCGGSPRLKVEGKLEENGAPFSVRSDSETLQVTFKTGPGAESQSFSPAIGDGTGTFTLLGADGKGVPPGTYTVEITCMPYGPPRPGRQGDRFRERYSAGKTPLKVEIKPETKQITIDVGKGTVTAS